MAKRLFQDDHFKTSHVPMLSKPTDVLARHTGGGKKRQQINTGVPTKRLKDKEACHRSRKRHLTRCFELFAEEGSMVFAGDIIPPKHEYSDGIESIDLDVISEADWTRAVKSIVKKKQQVRDPDQ